MQMSEEEICFRFKRNGCQKRHIEILAQLNGTRQMDIKEILHNHGLYEYTSDELKEQNSPGHLPSLGLYLEP